MIRDVLLAAASLIAGALLVAAARGALDTAREIGFGPFTASRRDGVPHGVQEDDAPAVRPARPWDATPASVDGPARGVDDGAPAPDVPDELVIAPSRISAATRSGHSRDR